MLGLLASRFATRTTGTRTRVFYEGGLWTRQVGQYFFPDSPRFAYTADTFVKRANQAKEYLSTAQDYWFQHYRPRAGDLIIDVGAGCGEDTLAFSNAAGGSGRVIAIEAHPSTFSLLESFCRLNNLRNTTPMCFAVMGKTGNVSVVESAHWERQSVDRSGGSSATHVTANTLDELCEREGIKDIAFLKMNIEGAEREAIDGMRASIDMVRTICIACHDFRADRGDGEHFRTKAVVERFLREKGFAIAYRRNDPRSYVRDHVHGFRSS